MPMVTIATKIPHITFVVVDNTIPKETSLSGKETKLKKEGSKM